MAEKLVIELDMDEAKAFATIFGFDTEVLLEKFGSSPYPPREKKGILKLNVLVETEVRPFISNEKQ